MRTRLLGLAAPLWLAAGHATADPAPAPTRAAAPPATSSAGKQVDAVVVNGAQQAYRSSIDRKSYSITGDLQATTGPISDALRNIPGLDVDVQGNLTLRGQPVTVMIDGKPSALYRGDAAGQALQSVSADRYERVEVITNPSAEFRPDGTGGIINLITRKNRKPGYSSSVKANYGSEGRYNGSVTGGYNSSKLTLSGTASYRRDPQKFVFSRTRETVDAAGDKTLSHNLNLPWGDGRFFSSDLSGDYDLDARTQVSAELGYFAMRIRSDNYDHYVADDAAGDPVGAYDQLGRFDLDVDVWNGQATWTRKFSGDGHELTVNLSQERDLQHQRSPDVLSVHLPAAPDVYEDTLLRATSDETDLKVDYVRPLPHEAKLKAGYELDLEEDDYDNFGARGPSQSGEAVDPSRTNTFSYKQAVNAAYASYERPLGDLTVLAGLRLETVNINLDQITSAVRASNDYTRAYPSLHLAYKFDDQKTLSASYSRRVQRPFENDLNPYRSYIDPYNYRQGNPYLKPQTTDSYEVAYELRRDGASYQATAYYRETQNVFTDVVEDLGGGVLLTTRDNLGSSHSGGGQLVASGKLSKSVSYNVSGDAYWSEVDAANLGFSGKRSAWTASGRANLNWQATASDFLQVNGNLYGKRLTAQGYRAAFGLLNLGYRHKFDERLSGVVTVRDLLATSKTTFVTETAQFRDRRVIEPNQRAIFVGLTYNFGGQGKKAPKDTGFDYGASGPPS